MNAHCVLTEAPPRPAPTGTAEHSGPRLVTVSAASPAALARQCEQLGAAVAASSAPFADIVRVLNEGRADLTHRVALLASDRAELAALLTERASVLRILPSAPAPARTTLVGVHRGTPSPVLADLGLRPTRTFDGGAGGPDHVELARLVEELTEDGPVAIVDLGSGDDLLAALRALTRSRNDVVIVAVPPGPDGALRAAATLYEHGVAVDWAAHGRTTDPDRPFRRLSLPGYPFDEESCWLPASRLRRTEGIPERPVEAGPAGAVRPAGDSAGELASSIRAVWSEVLRAEVPEHANYFGLGGNSITAMEIIEGIERGTGARLKLLDLYECPEPEQLAELIHRRSQPSAPSGDAITPGDELVLSFGQGGCGSTTSSPRTARSTTSPPPSSCWEPSTCPRCGRRSTTSSSGTRPCAPGCPPATGGRTWSSTSGSRTCCGRSTCPDARIRAGTRSGWSATRRRCPSTWRPGRCCARC